MPPRYRDEDDDAPRPDWASAAEAHCPPDERKPRPPRAENGRRAASGPGHHAEASAAERPRRTTVRRKTVSARSAARRHEHTVIDDFVSPPKKGMTWGKAICFFLFLPFNLIFLITRKVHWLVLWPLRVFLSVAFAGAVVATILIYVFGHLAERYDISQILQMPERTIVLDRKGREIGTLHGENRRRIEDLRLEVPQVFIDALLLKEDQRFFEHWGIDPRGVGRAVQQVFRHGRATQGASTLTMQLAKTTYSHRERSLKHKLIEIALARRIETTYDKQTILKAYINRIFWGHTFLGLKQAAYGYFNKTPRELTIGECAMLAGIICSPNEYSPYRRPDLARKQRDLVLGLLRDNGKITYDQYDAEIAKPLVTHKPEQRGQDNYALDLIRREVDHILDVLDAENKELKEETVYLGGLVVRTTLDLDLQDKVIGSINARLEEMLESRRGYKYQTRKQYQASVAGLPPSEREKHAPQYVQAAAVVIDNASGALLAVVGGRDSLESRYNRAIQARRQVGSLFKPFVYSAFFERGYAPGTPVSDNAIVPGEIAGGRNWRPHNADGRFTGMHPASYGLLKSRNTMSVRVGNIATIPYVVNFAQMAGFQRNIAKNPGPTIFLGTWEASPLDIAGAYTIFANGGVRPTPYIIESISDRGKRPLYVTRPNSRRVCSQRTALATSQILQQITKPGGTAGRTQALGFKNPCGGKTGTTNGYTNAWFCGFTSSLTASVWVGFDRQKTIMDKGYGGTLALPIWVDIMKAAAREGYPQKAIRTSPSSHSSQVLHICRESGGLAHAGCEAARTDYYETMPDVEAPRSLCTRHEAIADEVDAEPIAQDVDAMPDEAPNAEEPTAGEVPDDFIPTAVSRPLPGAPARRAAPAHEPTALEVPE